MSHPQIKRFRELNIELPARHYSLGGRYRLEAFQCRELAMGRSVELPGSRRLLADFEDVSNVITNLGLDHIGNRTGYGGYGQVGEGNSAESVADTTLDDYVAGQAVDAGSVTNWWAQATPPYFGGNQRKYRFVANFAGGPVNVSEVGVGIQAATGGLFSRALVKDGGGSPTTVAVSASEYFDLFYQLRNYPDHVNYTTGAQDDGTGSVVIGGVSYDYTIRCADITNYIWWGRNLFDGFFGPYAPGGVTQFSVYGSDAALGPVTGVPSATSSAHMGSGWSGVVVGSYANSTYTNTITYQLALGEGNVTGGIKAMVVYSSLGAYQILFSSPIPKNSGVELNYTQRTTWTRKTL